MRGNSPATAHDLQRFLDGDRPTPSSRPNERPTPTPRPATYTWGQSAHQPFTPAWYAEHPGAWRATHPHADLFAVAAAADLARWLAVPAIYAGTGGGSVVYEATEVVQTAPATATETAPSETSASPLAQPGSQPADEAAWMSIGVFALDPESGGPAHRMIQLSVSRQGMVRGTHYDSLSDDAQEIRGTVDKKDLRIAFTIGPSGKVVFEGPLAELTRPDGRLTARFPDGKTALWHTTPLKQPGT